MGLWLLLALYPTWATEPVRPISWGTASFTLGTVDLRALGRTATADLDRRTLVERLRQRGVLVLGAERQGPDRTVEARFALVGETRGRPEPGVTWQLLDRRDESVLFEALTPLDLELGLAGSLEPLERSLDQLVSSRAFGRALNETRRLGRRPARDIEVRRCLTPGTHGRGRIGRGARAEAAVVVSPDGVMWATARAIPVPPAPIEVRTTMGTVQARWLGASADLDIALLALPTGTETPCVAVAEGFPRAREPATAWHPRNGRTRTRILGFRLHEKPGTLVVEAPMLPGAFLFDAKGALLGVRIPEGGESRVRPHTDVARALGMSWGVRSDLPEPLGNAVKQPDPLYLPPVSRP